MSLKLGLQNKIRRSRAAGGFVGLLDQPFAQGATFALALRLLRAKHSGGLIRNRADDAGTDKGEADVLPRLQPDGSKIIELNSPIENLNSKAQTRLGAPQGGGDKVLADLVDAGGANYDGFVSKAYDQSGNSNDASQSNASKQPLIVDAGNIIKKNNKPIIHFNDNTKNLQAAALTNSQPLTLFFATSVNDVSINNDDFHDNLDSSLFLTFTGGANKGKLSFFASNNIGSVTTINDNEYFLCRSVFDGVNSFMYKNATEIITDKDAGTTGLSGGLIIGKRSDLGRGSGKKFSELIVYNESITGSSKIESNINNHYSIF